MPELIWDGKYDENGKRVAVPKLALPFQTIEIVNEDNAARERTLSLFAEGRESDWRNRLIWGDKKWVLPSLLPEFGGKVDLIYIDPPFDTGADFSFSAQIPDDPNTPGDQSQSFVKEPSVLELKAYRDIWGGAKTHLDAYLKWFYETVVVLYDLLSPTGSIYVHLDYRMIHYARAILDEIFGTSNFRNEVIWCYRGMAVSQTHYVRRHDTILFYTKTDKYPFNWSAIAEGLEATTQKKYKYADEKNRRFRLHGRNIGGSPIQNHTDIELSWLKTHPDLVRVDYLDEKQGVKPRDWFVMDYINVMSNERVDYPTQKPEALLERIIKASSNEGDLVLDCFCGSGTTAAVAEKLGRRWITCDLGRFAIHTARKRLLGIGDLKPFAVQNLGKYERQAWRKQEIGMGGDEGERQRRYRQFILELYRARPLEGYTWLHGVKNGRFVHVGSVDSPVAEGDVTQIALEWKRATGGALESPATNGIDILGWEFAFELNDLKRQQAERANLQIAFKRIPREVMEKRAADSGEIQFFELAALELDCKTKGLELELRLKNFISPPDYLPADIQAGITNWEQLVDYWAIDWTFQGDSFHNQWQSYRTRSVKTLDKTAKFTYNAAGIYRVVVKVIDILGNDTTKMVEIEVK